jgi:hypothetical protein
MRIVCRLSFVWLRSSCQAQCGGCIKEDKSVGRPSARNDNRRVRPLKIGYARVSTSDQRLDLQIDALRGAGCDVIYREVAPGDAMERQGLSRALAACRKGDVLMVWKMDRLCRGLFAFLQLLNSLSAKGIVLRVLTSGGNAADSSTPEGRLLLGILACVAEFELELIRERTRAGVHSVRRRRRTLELGPGRSQNRRLMECFNASSGPWRQATAACAVRHGRCADQR